MVCGGTTLSPPVDTLRTVLEDLAARFVADVLAAIRSASLEDLLAESSAAPRRRRGRTRGAEAAPADARARVPPLPLATGRRLARRLPTDIENALGLVVAALGVGPMRSEEIQKLLGLGKRELPRVLKHGLATKRLKSTGSKRATLYSAA
jgi:hypothetical protein